jgi:trimethylamine---corrinoid protein Co-methyltransferase
VTVPIVSAKKIKQIDAVGRDILERVGIKVLDEEILRRLKRSGARIDSSRQTAYLDADWLASRLSEAPSAVCLYARRSDRHLRLKKGRVHFGNGGRVFQLLDTATRKVRPTVLQDIANTAVLVDRLPHLDFFIIPCQAHDIPADHYHLNDFFQAFNHTRKHVMGGCDTVEGVRQMHDLASTVAGDPAALAAEPFVSVITNPISPLTFDPVALRILEFCTAKGLPVTCAPAPISGATAPVTLAGTLVQMHAEALAGVALIQMLRPGAPALYGSVISTMDMRKMNLAMGSVESAMMNAAAVSLAHLHRLPIYASAGLTDAKVPDIQAGAEKMLSNLLVARAGAEFIHLAAGMLDSGNTICYEQYVADDEMIAMIHRLLRGIDVDTQTLAAECIQSVGPGGNYVLEDHTVDHMLDQHFYPQHCVRMPFDAWARQDEPTMVSGARQRVRELLSDAGPLLDRQCLERISQRFPQIRNRIRIRKASRERQ